VQLAERTPLLPKLPPLVFCDERDRGKELQARNGSYTNQWEVQVVIAIVRMLLTGGHVLPSQIGIIALCR
jgi:hypothetical protein